MNPKLSPPEPQIIVNLPPESIEAISLDDNINYPKQTFPVQYSRSKSNLDQVYDRPKAKRDTENVQPTRSQRISMQNSLKLNLQRQRSCKDAPDDPPKNNNIRHCVSEANITRSSGVGSRNQSRKNSISKPSHNSSVPNISKNPSGNVAIKRNMNIYVSSPKLSPDEEYAPKDDYVPMPVDRPVGLDLSDFLPQTHQPFGARQQMPDMSETEVLNVIMGGHGPMMTMLSNRQRNLKIVHAQFRNSDLKGAIETAITLNDMSIIVELLGILNSK